MLISLDHVIPLARAVPTGALNRQGDIEIGELLTSVVVMAANVVRDIRENIRNLVGGRMAHYEALIEEAVDAALVQLENKAKERGYDGVIGVKISHPQVVDGGVEIIAYGNGFRYLEIEDA